VTIPGMSTLADVAGVVLKHVPEELARGEIDTGLYGMGFLGRWALPRLKRQGIRLTSCFDSNAALTGTFTENIPIRAASELETVPPEFVIVTARHAVAEVAAKLARLRIPQVSYDAWIAASDFERFREVHDDILLDERSRQVLRAVLMTMLTGEAGYCADVCEGDQYFCLPQFYGSQQEIYVDAGAFDGDSVEAFLAAHAGVVTKIHAFEPGPRQFADLWTRTERLRADWALRPGSIAVINAGLGERNGTAHAGTNNGQWTSFAVGPGERANGVTVQIVGLDNHLAGDGITFLKADVEGMEMELLRGAEATIKRHRPKIAICVYHYPTDIPEIANHLRKLVPEYRFALRHHSPQLMETVLYCWIDG
jgi:FkbM family methyltransferase